MATNMTSLLALTPTAWIVTGLATFTIYAFLWTLYTHTLHRFADIPGPFWASVSRGWLIVHVLRGDLEKVTRALHQAHGPIVRIAPDEVSIAAPSEIKQLYGTGRPHYPKTDFYLPLRSNISKYPDHLTNLDSTQHLERKRIVSTLYTASTAIEAEPHITACVKTLINKLRIAARSRDVLELSDWM
jgi:hypothetical protein